MKLVLAAAAAGLLSGPALADALCDRIEAGTVHSLHVPGRVFTVIREDGKPDITSELIRTADTQYLRTGTGDKMEGWKVTPYDADKNESKRNAATVRDGESCRADGGDTIEGEAVDVIYHELGGTLKGAHERVWLSHATDLPLKSEAELAPSLHIILTYDYKATTPPADAPAK